MKKLKVVLSMMAILTGIFSFSSCKKNSYKCCVTYGSQKYCETVSATDFDNDKEFREYIKYLEKAGYSCK